MAASEYRPVEIPEGSEISSDAQHQAVQIHIKDCAQCKEAISQSGRHVTSDYSSKSGEFGLRTKMCEKYLQIIAWFASQ